MTPPPHLSPTASWTATRSSSRSAERPGLSLLEVLIASALLGMLILATLPLFTRAALLNQAGRRSTLAAHLAGSRAEELLRLPFQASLLDPASQGEVTTIEYRARGALDWSSERPVDSLEWIRTTSRRSYPAEALDDRELSADEILPAGAHRPAQLQEIEVEVRAASRGGLFGAGARAYLRVLKAH